MKFPRDIFSVQKTLFFTVPLFICLLFFIAYGVLSIVRHQNYQSFGYDLGINDQAVWKYSQFKYPVVTIDPFPDKTKFAEHVELVFVFISPFYWIWNSRQMLLLLEPAFVCFAGFALFQLSRKHNLKSTLCFALLFAYLAFYGVQNAIWFDVHSTTFAAAFVAVFLYFTDQKKWVWASIFFFLALTAKEDTGAMLFAIEVVYFLKRRSKMDLGFILISVVYELFIFFVFFPHIMHVRYLYQGSGGIFSHINPIGLIDTPDNRTAIFYTFASFGFIPVLVPLLLLPALAHFYIFFVIASHLTAAQGIFEQYRVMLAPLMVWATIFAVIRFKRLNSVYTALYIVFCIVAVQYILHLPLSYLTKDWFWHKPAAVATISQGIHSIPSNASVVAQNNIIPHMSHRDYIYELYPEKKKFSKKSPCGKEECDWFTWYDHPEYLIVDTSPEWDIRHLLADRPVFLQGLANIENAGVVKKEKQFGTTVIYKILKSPDSLE